MPKFESLLELSFSGNNLTAKKFHTYDSVLLSNLRRDYMAFESLLDLGFSGSI
jgi:hypothetical protein